MSPVCTTKAASGAWLEQSIGPSVLHERQSDVGWWLFHTPWQCLEHAHVKRRGWVTGVATVRTSRRYDFIRCIRRLVCSTTHATCTNSICTNLTIFCLKSISSKDLTLFAYRGAVQFAYSIFTVNVQVTEVNHLQGFLVWWRIGRWGLRLSCVFWWQRDCFPLSNRRIVTHSKGLDAEQSRGLAVGLHGAKWMGNDRTLGTHDPSTYLWLLYTQSWAKVE